MAERKLTGKIARERIQLMEAPRPPAGTVEGYRALGHASGILSDVMDELGITGVIAASVLRPTMPGTCIVGPALTVRNMIQREHAYETARRHVNKMAEFEAHNLALPGDVVVIEGVPGISNMGIPCPPPDCSSTSISLSSSSLARSLRRNESRVTALAVEPTRASSTRSSAATWALA